jgi:hypothetical protein
LYLENGMVASMASSRFRRIRTPTTCVGSAPCAAPPPPPVFTLYTARNQRLGLVDVLHNSAARDSLRKTPQRRVHLFAMLLPRKNSPTTIRNEISKMKSPARGGASHWIADTTEPGPGPGFFFTAVAFSANSAARRRRSSRSLHTGRSNSAGAMSPSSTTILAAPAAACAARL